MKKRCLIFVLAFLVGMLLSGTRHMKVSAKSRTPAMPSISVSAKDNGKITVVIDETENAQGYEVFYGLEGSVGFSKLADIKKDGNKKRSITFDELSSGTYLIKARAYAMEEGTKILGLCGSEEKVKVQSFKKAPRKIKLSDEVLKEVKKRILYKVLNKKEKEFYVRVYAAMLELESEVPISDLKLSEKSLQKVFWYILSECPEIFWVDDTKNEWNSSVFRIFYTRTKEEVVNRSEQLKTKAQDLIESAVTYYPDAIEQVLCLNSIVGQNEYDTNYDYEDDELRDSAGSDDVIIDGKGICVGFSRAFAYLCKEAGYKCIMVTGLLDGKYEHAFNVVRINGKWYLVEPQEVPDSYDDDIKLYSEGLWNWTKIKNTNISEHYKLDEIFKIDSIESVGMLSDVWRESKRSPYDDKHWVSWEESGDYRYVVLDNGTALLYQYIGTDETVYVPESIDGIPVSYFRPTAFNECDAYKIVLNETTNIAPRKSDYINDRFLERIEVPDSNPYLKIMDGILFSKDGTILYWVPGGNELRDLIIPEGVKDVYYLGESKDYEKIVIPGSIQKFESYQDLSCEKLIFLEGVKVIDLYGHCLVDNQLLLPRSTTYIGFFSYAKQKVKRIAIDEKNEYYKVEKGFLLSKNGEKLILISSSLYDCFDYEENYIYQLRIPEGVKKVYNLPYWNHRQYKLYIPESVEMIDEDLFRDRAPYSVEVDNNNDSFVVYDNALYTKNMKELVYHFCGADKEYIVPEGVEIIGSSAFCYDKDIKKIVLSESVCEITGFCFMFTNATVVVAGKLDVSGDKGCNSFWQAGDDTVIKCKKNKDMVKYSERHGIKLKKFKDSDMIVSRLKWNPKPDLPVGCGPTFDDQGNMVTYIFTDGSVENNEYDDEGYLSFSTTTTTEKTTRTEYYKTGREKCVSTVFHNGTTAEYEYDENGDSISETYIYSDGTKKRVIYEGNDYRVIWEGIA